MKNRISCRKSGNSIAVVFQGAMTVDRIEKLRAVFLKILAGGKTFLLDLSGVKQADSSFLQLLCSADKYAENRSKALLLNGEISGELRRMIQLTGFFKHARTDFAESVKNEVWS
ncbi:MAG: STAS domain-containing protein [Spirochaetia bacterium]